MEQRTELPTADEIIAGLDARIDCFSQEGPGPLGETPPAGQNLKGNVMEGCRIQVRHGIISLEDAKRVAKAYNEKVAAKGLGLEYQVDPETYFQQNKQAKT